MISIKYNLQQAYSKLLTSSNYNHITKEIITYLSQPYYTAIGFYAILDNYDIQSPIGLKKQLITLLIDLVHELQKNNNLNTEEIKELHSLKTLFSITNHDFKKYSHNDVQTIISVQEKKVIRIYKHIPLTINRNFIGLKELFGIGIENEDKHEIGSIYLQQITPINCALL